MLASQQRKTARMLQEDGNRECLVSDLKKELEGLELELRSQLRRWVIDCGYFR
jgi:hypothetical protein